MSDAIREMLQAAERDEATRAKFLHEAEAPSRLLGGNAMSVDERYAYVRARARTPEQTQAEYDSARAALSWEFAKIQRTANV
jgi:hypothetical protein